MHPNLKAVIFDWAGTMIDFGSRAPVIALCRLFADHEVPITEAEAQEDMGRAKWDHIACLLAKPRIAAAWAEAHGAPPVETDARMLFDRIGPAMTEAARDCAVLIPGAAEVAGVLQQAGVKIGSCTGYTREMMAAILPLAAEQGYRPDCVVCAGETTEGRPSPLMAWKNLVELGAWPAGACVKVDDTEVGLAEGRNAGLWTVAVAATGNALGLSAADLAALPAAEREARLAAARARLSAAGAHRVIDSVADLPAALAELPIGQPAPA
ncbi:phosphonoacetaldehyde hydrolase [Altererythrobacter sp. B11]|uniref:phosphonoacetaldehyde hydrolase n=1 Tax=Altererythrobacter sp. B11 TaxID=2060312 RepID=UPI000E5BAB25|nr:phosphonoacetaldehyde hydrolase [Altererythrobacter sp. B11]